MRQHSFGAQGPAVGVIGQGTWYLDQASRKEAVASLHRGLDLGMNHIDTAEMYGSGAAEGLVGEAIRGRRDEVFVVSKVLPHNASRQGVRTACEQSLERLGTDRLDCYLLHWRGSHPLEETFAAFEALHSQGKILSYGVSNFDADDIDEAIAIVGPGRIACNQVLYHLRERAIEHAVLPACERHGISVVAYSPFGHDDFPEPDSAQGRVLDEIAAHHDATPRQIALAFLTRRPSLFAIPKAARPKHVEDNAAAGRITLTQEDVDRIDLAFPRGPEPRHLPMI